MRSTPIVVLVALAACASREPVSSVKKHAPTESPVRTEEPQVEKLRNGVPVYFMPGTSSSLELHVVWNTGAVNDPPGAAGLAGLTLGSMDDEIGGRSVSDTQAHLAKLGAKI